MKFLFILILLKVCAYINIFLISKVELVFELSGKAKYQYQNKEIKKLKMENQGYVSFRL